MTEDPGVEGLYPVREDTELLLPLLDRVRGLRLLEIGCGRGALALAAARSGALVVATDLNPAAVAFVRRSARAEGLALDAVRTDLARGLRQFDRIYANPPYLPTSPAARDPDAWVNLALDGGPDGLRITGRLFREIPAHLRPGGRGYLLVSSRQGAAALARLRSATEAAGHPIRGVSRRVLGEETLEVLEIRRGDRRSSD